MILRDIRPFHSTNSPIWRTFLTESILSSKQTAKIVIELLDKLEVTLNQNLPSFLRIIKIGDFVLGERDPPQIYDVIQFQSFKDSVLIDFKARYVGVAELTIIPKISTSIELPLKVQQIKVIWLLEIETTN